MTPAPTPPAADLASLTTLDDPVRRRLYDFVCGQSRPAGREEAAAAAGIGRPLAAYHLDKLVESGLLTASYQRPPDRSGPGAGPAKVYARSEREFAVAVPAREYELAARLLVQAVESDGSGDSQTALRGAAERFGTDAGTKFRQSGPSSGEPQQDLQTLLQQHGYEPGCGQDGTVRLRNCPFHQLAEQHREVVCDMNLALIGGLMNGLGTTGQLPVLDPRPGYCCVAISQEPT